MPLRLKVYAFLALPIALILGWYLVGQHHFGEDVARANSSKPGDSQQLDETAVPVELRPVKLGPISSYLTSTANLRPLRDIELATQADGVIREVVVEEGDFVKEGQLLCLLDDRELLIKEKLTEQRLAQARLQLEKSTIQLEKSETQIENTRTELERQEAAFAEKLVSEQEVDKFRYQLQELQHDQRVAASNVRELRHRVDELEAEIEQVQLELSRARIEAPFSGYITHRTVELGQTVRNLDSLFRLGAFSPLYADVHLPEREAHRVGAGQKATIGVDANTDLRVVGRVVRVSPIVDGATGTIKVTVELETKESAFRPGAFVRVDIETDFRTGVILVPKRSIVEEDGEQFIFVVEHGTAHRRRVTLGYENDVDVEVREGVAHGEQVVVAGQGNLREDDKVRQVKGS